MYYFEIIYELQDIEAKLLYPLFSKICDKVKPYSQL